MTRLLSRFWPAELLSYLLNLVLCVRLVGIMAGITAQTLQKLQSNFSEDRANFLALNTCVKYGPEEVLHSRKNVELINHTFNHKVPEVKPVTSQKSSGRCWIFALLNVIRQQCQSNFNVDELEFSQTFIFFHDKIERSHYLLRTYVELAKMDEEIDGRLFMFLLHNPIDDGGQWAMLVNLVEKYGLMPRSCHSEAFSSTSSRNMDTILNGKLRENCYRIKEMVDAGKSDKFVEDEINRMMNEIYRVCAICLGIPPTTFTWEYYDKDKKYNCIKDITPYKFYHEHIKPIFNLEDKVCLVNDPRTRNKYGKVYTVQYLNNMVNGRPVLYLNQPIEILRSAAIKSLRNNEPLWFGCDVDKHLDNKKGAMDLRVHDYELVFGFSMLGLNKAERLLSGSTMMTHAMVFTGMHIEEEGDQKQEVQGDHAACKVSRWRVENSWGEESGNKGYYVMTDEWFDEYTFEVVVDKKYLSDDILQALKQEPIVLPAWDPMGSLAH